MIRDTAKSEVASMCRDLRLEGDIVCLRPVRLEDVNEDYYRWLNDSEVNQYMETRFSSQSPEEIERYVKDMLDKTGEIFFFAICLKECGKHIGNIKLGPINRFHRFAWISLFIGEKAWWGKGITSEAIALVRDYAFGKLGLHKLMAGCYANNTGSARAFEKAGFIREGIEKSKWSYGGGYVDGLLFGLVNPKE